MSRDASIEEKAAYIQGLKDGITKYAWWKNGVQEVGTTGTTLKKALARVDEEHWNLKRL